MYSRLSSACWRVKAQYLPIELEDRWVCLMDALRLNACMDIAGLSLQGWRGCWIQWRGGTSRRDLLRCPWCLLQQAKPVNGTAGQCEERNTREIAVRWRKTVEKDYILPPKNYFSRSSKKMSSSSERRRSPRTTSAENKWKTLGASDEVFHTAPFDPTKTA